MTQPMEQPERSEQLDLQHKLKRLQGPILVLGGSGFIGANLARLLLTVRDDVVATTSRMPAWRLQGLPPAHVHSADLLVESNLDQLLKQAAPRTVFDCIAYGAYSFETDPVLIYQTNFAFQARLLSRIANHRLACYVHAGSSSEYGDNASGPAEDSPMAPNSDYAVSKVAAAHLIWFVGKKKKLPVANLRLYSVYGPLEDASRLIPNLLRHGVLQRYPEFVDPRVSRDFLYVDDACEAFVDTALNLQADDYGESFNIGTGHMTTIADVAAVAKELFGIEQEPSFSMPNRAWDVRDWYANISKARRRLGWNPRTAFRDGLERSAAWYRSLADPATYHRASRQFGLDAQHSASAVVACYGDGQAIPIMYQRLKATFEALKIEYEIIFVNDCSPDDSEEIIRGITRNDRRVTGISHSRNFGSQAAFRSGMELATKNACVLLDGDLQDPPELIEQFVLRWREGYDVVYGRRAKRDAPFFMRVAYKLFYRLFDLFSYVRIPHDAGDFGLMDRRVVKACLRFPERDLFLRGVRAYAGFKQVGVDYVRPRRLFGRTTNSLFKNIGWAKKGILSFSNVPLNMLSFGGVALFGISVLLVLTQVVLKLLFPEMAPAGLTTVLVVIAFFGALNLLALSLVGEYVAKIFEESKQRPHYIRRNIVRDGEIRPAADVELK